MADYGAPPYHESSLKSVLRFLAAGARGAGAGMAAPDPFSAFGGAFQMEQNSSNAARRAAEAYAMKQEEARRQQEHDDIWKRSIDAQIKQMEKPAAVPDWARTKEERDQMIKFEADKAAALAAARPKETKEPKSESLVLVEGPDGNPVYVRQSAAVGKRPPKSSPKEKPVTGAERGVLAFYNRAKTAEDTIGKLEGKMSRLSLARQAQLRYAPNVAQSPDMQVYRQAQRAFTEARLRKESGAAIPQGEYDTDAQTYFAQPGDAPDTVKAKKAARKAVLDGLKYSSGKAYDEFYGEQAQGGGNDPLGIR